jgi:hypothetical protein
VRRLHVLQSITIAATQIAGYLADLNGHQAPEGTTALINIGSNDYEAFLKFNLPPQEIQTFVANVVGSIDQAITTLTTPASSTSSCSRCPTWGPRRLRKPWGHKWWRFSMSST